MAKNKQNNKQPLNQKVTDERLGSVLATLEKRQKEGTLGPNEKRRLQDLRARTAAPVTGGGVITTTENIQNDGSVVDEGAVIDESGKTFDPSDPYWTDLYKTTYQNTFDLGTAGLEKRQAREVEEARQMAAERGLPYDPTTQGAYGDPNTAYGKQVQGGVVDRYDDLYSQADNQAHIAAQSAYQAQAGLSNDAFVSQIQARLGISEAQARAEALRIQREELANQKYGIDKDFQAKKMAINKPTGGGSSGGGGASTGGGFEII